MGLYCRNIRGRYSNEGAGGIVNLVGLRNIWSTGEYGRGVGLKEGLISINVTGKRLRRVGYGKAVRAH